MSGPFVIAVELDGDGAHPASWRAARHAPDELLTGRRVARVVRDAERAGFTIATFEDSPLPPGAFPDVIGRIEAIQRAAFAAPITGGIGLVPVAHVVYSEPFHVATQLSSLDHVSSGRAGWIVGSDPDARIAAEYGRDPVIGHEALTAEVADVVETSRRLWDSWEDGAVIRDVATGRYLDRERIHYADFVGGSFSVKGPAIVPRPPQGQLVVFAEADLAGQAGVDVALVSVGGRVLDEERTVSAVEAVARGTTTPRVVAELEVVLDAAGVPAAGRLAALDADTPWIQGERARYVGNSSGLVELLTELARVVDGVRLHPAVLDVDLDELGRTVLPELRRRGVFLSPRAGQSLRESLGLPRPDNRFASAAPAPAPVSTPSASIQGARR